MYLIEACLCPICRTWELFSLFALPASRLEGGLVLSGLTVTHSLTWRILYPSVWCRADMGLVQGTLQPCSHHVVGSEVWVEQCLTPCLRETRPRDTCLEGHTRHVPISYPAAHHSWECSCLCCPPWAVAAGHVWPTASLPAWSLGLVFSALSVDEIRIISPSSLS